MCGKLVVVAECKSRRSVAVPIRIGDLEYDPGKITQ